MSKMSEALKNYVPKTTVGKGRHYLSTEEGAGMTAKPVKKSRRDMIAYSMKDM